MTVDDLLGGLGGKVVREEGFAEGLALIKKLFSTLEHNTTASVLDHGGTRPLVGTVDDHLGELLVVPGRHGLREGETLGKEDGQTNLVGVDVRIW